MPRIMSRWAGNTSWLLSVRAAGRNLSQSWSCCDSSGSILGSALQTAKGTCRWECACACACGEWADTSVFCCMSARSEWCCKTKTKAETSTLKWDRHAWDTFELFSPFVQLKIHNAQYTRLLWQTNAMHLANATRNVHNWGHGSHWNEWKCN